MSVAMAGLDEERLAGDDGRQREQRGDELGDEQVDAHGAEEGLGRERHLADEVAENRHGGDDDQDCRDRPRHRAGDVVLPDQQGGDGDEAELPSHPRRAAPPGPLVDCLFLRDFGVAASGPGRHAPTTGAVA